MDLNVRSGDPGLFDQQPHEALPLFEVQGIHTLPDAARKGRDPARQPVVDGQLSALVQERLALLLQASLTIAHLVMSCPKRGEVNRLHLVEVSDPSLFGFRMVQTTIEAVQLRGE